MDFVLLVIFTFNSDSTESRTNVLKLLHQSCEVDESEHRSRKHPNDSATLIFILNSYAKILTESLFRLDFHPFRQQQVK